MGVLASPWYRVGQFCRNLTAQVQVSEIETVRQLLPASAYPLFAAMNQADRRHSLDVCRKLQTQGWEHAKPLLVAALLHDCGKAQATIRPWQRALWVLAKIGAPGLAAYLEHGKPQSWRWPFRVLAQHAELGADAAAKAGCPPEAVCLIRYHQQGGADLPAPCNIWLQALCAVDDAS